MKYKILIINITILLFSCGNSNQDTSGQKVDSIGENYVRLTNEQYRNAGIDTGKLSMRNISSVLKLNGKIDVPPQSMISISVPLGGYLKSTRLLNGMHINKGEVLAVLEDIQYIQLQQDYLSAKTQFTLTEKEYSRQKELNRGRASSDKELELSRANYQSQLVLIKSIEEKLKLIGLNPSNVNINSISNRINITSPITGYVSAVNVNIGKYIGPDEVMFELVNPTDIHLMLTVFEKDINKLSIGQMLYAYTNNNPDKKYTCKIILIGKIISNKNAAEVHCHFEQFDKSLLPGMFMNADVELKAYKSSVLPEDAVVRFENKHYVFIVSKKNIFEMREVKIGDTENGYTAITDSEQSENETIAVKGAYTLLMALKNKSEE